MIIESNFFDMIFLILLIYIQVLCRLRDFNKEYEGGFHLRLHGRGVHGRGVGGFVHLFR